MQNFQALIDDSYSHKDPKRLVNLIKPSASSSNISRQASEQSEQSNTENAKSENESLKIMEIDLNPLPTGKSEIFIITKHPREQK